MLDPRSLAERRDEIAASCRRRGVTADVDGAVALQAQVAAKQTELNEANRRRNEHQEAGKRSSLPTEREAHGRGARAQGGGRALEAELAAQRVRLDGALAKLPNFIHPDVPDGGEDDARELRRCRRADALRLRAARPPRARREARPLRLRRRRQGGGPEVLLPEERGGAARARAPALRARRAARGGLHALRHARSRARRDRRRPRLQPARRRDADLLDRERATCASSAPPRSRSAGSTRTRSSRRTSCRCASSPASRTASAPRPARTGRESKGLYRVHQFTKVEMFAFTRPEDSEAMHARAARDRGARSSRRSRSRTA